MTPLVGHCSILLEIKDTTSDNVWVANDHVLVEFADKAELTPVGPRDHASIGVRGGPEEGLIDEHPVHSRCAGSLLLRHQKQNASSRVGIEQCVGGCEVI